MTNPVRRRRRRRPIRNVPRCRARFGRVLGPRRRRRVRRRDPWPSRVHPCRRVTRLAFWRWSWPVSEILSDWPSGNKSHDRRHPRVHLRRRHGDEQAEAKDKAEDASPLSDLVDGQVTASRRPYPSSRPSPRSCPTCSPLRYSPSSNLKDTLNLAQVNKWYNSAVWSVDGVRSIEAKVEELAW